MEDCRVRKCQVDLPGFLSEERRCLQGWKLTNSLILKSELNSIFCSAVVSNRLFSVDFLHELYVRVDLGVGFV